MDNTPLFGGGTTHKARNLLDAKESKKIRRSQCFSATKPRRFRGERPVNLFRQFYRDNKDKLFGYILRKTGDYHLAADTMQESFTRYLERYDKNELSVPLLFTISRHLLIDNARRQQMTVPFDEERHDRIQGRDPSLIREESQRLLQAIAQLEPEEADILSLATGSNLSYKKIAEIMGTSEANIKVKIHRSRLKLKTILSAGEA